MRKYIFSMFVAVGLLASTPLVLNAQGKETIISGEAYEACVEYGEEYGICPELLMAIIERESRGKPDAENGSCKGLMQVSVRRHKDRMKRLNVADIFDERGNILVGTDYLAELFKKYNEVSKVLMVYNGDSRAFEEGYISDFVKGILERSAELERLHGK